MNWIKTTGTNRKNDILQLKYWVTKLVKVGAIISPTYPSEVTSPNASPNLSFSSLVVFFRCEIFYL